MFSHNYGKFDWFLWRIRYCLPFSSLIILIVKTNIVVFSLINCQISFSTPPDSTSVVKESQRSRSGNMMSTVSLYLTKQTWQHLIEAVQYYLNISGFRVFLREEWAVITHDKGIIMLTTAYREALSVSLLLILSDVALNLVTSCFDLLLCRKYFFEKKRSFFIVHILSVIGERLHESYLKYSAMCVHLKKVLKCLACVHFP